MDTAFQSSADKIKVLAHQQYDSSDHLSPSTVPDNPLDLFRRWFTSMQGTVNEPEAMALSTASAEGIPSTRIVLLKQVDNRGFIFFTNYHSRKSREMDANPFASLAFYWREIHRQVRVVGRVEKVSREESEVYFRSRPLGSQIGAWASNQSAVIAEGELGQQITRTEERFGVKEGEGDVDADIPLPDHWGGWRVIPTEVEFWAGKPSRLHDRVRYRRVEGPPTDPAEWKAERLSP